MGRWVDGWVNRWAEEKVDGWVMDESVDGWVGMGDLVDGGVDEWTAERLPLACRVAELARV